MNTQALSASTAQDINGSSPYLTFDNGVTKVTTTDGLLSITLSDGTTQTIYTPENNTSTKDDPIVLPKENQSFEDIGMLIPTNANSITLNNLIGAPYNYWGDDDGDGQGTDGITATGSLKVRITDKENKVVSRNTVLSLCNAPYKVVLTSTDGSITTKYGVPNSSSFTGSSATYYIKPKNDPVICYVRPSLEYGTNDESGRKIAGPVNIWNPKKGFLPQSTEPSSYGLNFPTTGANDLYFDLDIAGTGPLRWPTVTKGGITATMTRIPDEPNNIRVTLTGPAATYAQLRSNQPGTISKPTLQQPFELVGYDSSNRAVVKYGFILKQWFVNRGDSFEGYDTQSSWCSSIGYRMPQVKDLTNAVCSGVNASSRCHGTEGAKPSSVGNYYQRNIGAGLFTEWGKMCRYDAGFNNYWFYWTSDRNPDQNQDYAYLSVWSSDGNVLDGVPYGYRSQVLVCAYP